MKLSDLFDVNLLAKMLSEGMVNRQYHPVLPLAILNYSHACQFAREWNEVTMQCRGLIYNMDTEEIIARPFPKFFNAEELGPSKLGQALGANVQATDKLDGSLGVLYPDSSTACGWSIATRGSFISDQAIKASMLLEDGYAPFWDDGPSTGNTYLFEIIYPENRIVLDYGDKQMLVLLAVVHNSTGLISGPDSGHASFWPGPRAEIFPATSVKEVRALPYRDNAEGFVLRNTKTGFMAKIKYEEYVRIHRIIFGMNERVVYKHMREGRAIADLYYGVPEEFHDWIDEAVEGFHQQFVSIRHQVLVDFDEIEKEMVFCSKAGRSRKKIFAESAKQKKYPHLLFLLYDKNNKDKLVDEIWKLIPFDGRNKMTAEVSEDVA